jgi:tRNA pseudouridine38-40 synthase
MQPPSHTPSRILLSGLIISRDSFLLPSHNRRIKQADNHGGQPLSTTMMNNEPLKRNFKLVLQYDGSNYHGSQLQLGVQTIQGVVEDALEQILGEKVRIHAAGRTDAGVHALGQVIHFNAHTDISSDDLKSRLNGVLPEDIRVLSSEEMPLSFHSRYHAIGKVYRYTILNSKIRGRYTAKSAHVFSAKLDLDRMREAASYLVGTHDFSAFGVNPGREVSNAIRTIKRLDLRREGHYIFIELEADGFLYKMVRSIVGTLINVGVGKTTPEEIPKILESRDRCRAGATAPPHGLCLVEVKYCEEKS